MIRVPGFEDSSEGSARMPVELGGSGDQRACPFLHASLGASVLSEAGLHLTLALAE